MATVAKRTRTNNLVRSIPTAVGIEDSRTRECLMAISENLISIADIVVAAQAATENLPQISVKNAGNGLPLWNAVSNHQLTLKTITGSGRISVRNSDGLIVISTTDYAAGTGISISGTTVSLSFSDLSSLSVLNQASDTLIVNSSNTPKTITLPSLMGGLAAATVDPSTDTIQFYDTSESVLAKALPQDFLNACFSALGSGGAYDYASQSLVGLNASNELVTLGIDLDTILSDYVTSSALSTTLTGYPTNAQLAAAIEDFVTDSELGTALEDYPTNSELATAIADFVTDTELATAIADFVTDSELATALSSYTLTSALNTAFASYLAGISGYSGSANQVLMNDSGTLKWVTVQVCS